MKSLTSLLLLSMGMAYAQGPEGFRRRDQGVRIVGRYESLQRDDTVRRTLVLERDGRAEVLTDVRRGRGDRRKWDGDDTKSYGTLAEAAAEDNRAIRHSGRWTEDNGRIVLVLTDRTDVRGRENKVQMELRQRSGELLFDNDQKVYGRAKISFRRDGVVDGGRPPIRAPRFGTVRYDGTDWNIETVNLIDRGANSRLVIRASSRRFELRGTIRRSGDDVVFTLPDDGSVRERGEYTLRMRGNEVQSIRGSGTQDRHRIEIRG